MFYIGQMKIYARETAIMKFIEACLGKQIQEHPKALK